MSSMHVGSFDAWVTIEGDVAQVYDSRVDEGRSISQGWIASTAGKNFAVHCRAPNVGDRFSDYLARVWVDGVSRGGIVMSQHSSNPIMVLGKVATSLTTDRLLTFADVETTDDDAYLHTVAAAQHLGEITLNVFAGIGGAVQMRSPTQENTNIKLHERSKKCGVHQTRLGREVAATQQHSVPFVALVQEPIATFTFRYRPMDLLIAHGIVPRPPRATPSRTLTPSGSVLSSSGSSTTIDGTRIKSEPSDEERIRRLEAQLRALKGKRKATEEPSTSRKKSKIEAVEEILALGHAARADRTQELAIRHRSAFVPGEVIDLT